MNRAIIVVLLVFFVCSFFNDQVPSAYAKGQLLKEPGKCPKPEGGGICVEKCKGDGDCPGRKKCCSNGCGHVCVKPVLKKPGKCPKPEGGGICVEKCKGDGDCPGWKKCCSNGCGHVCVKPENSCGTSDLDLTSLHTVIITVLYSVTIAVALTGNLLLIFIVTRRPETRTLTGFLFLNMAAADLMVTLVFMPLTMAIPFSEIKWLPGVIGDITCKGVYYGFHVTIAASISSLVFMSVDRYLAVIFPLRIFSKFRRAKVLSFVIWLISMIVTIPAAVPWINKKYPHGMYCIADFADVFGDYQKGALFFYIYLFLIIYLIPLLVISVLYCLVCYRLWRRNIPGLVSSDIEQRHEATKRKVVRTLIIITAAFALCWLPMQAYHLILAFNLQLHCRLPRIVMFVCFWGGNANSALNPWLYMLLTDKFRIAIRDIYRVRSGASSRYTQYTSVRKISSAVKQLPKIPRENGDGLLKVELERRETAL